MQSKNTPSKNTQKKDKFSEYYRKNDVCNNFDNYKQNVFLEMFQKFMKTPEDKKKYMMEKPISPLDPFKSNCQSNKIKDKNFPDHLFFPNLTKNNLKFELLINMRIKAQKNSRIFFFFNLFSFNSLLF